MFLKPKHFIFECRPNFGSFFPLPGLLRAITFSAPKPPLYKFLRTPLLQSVHENTPFTLETDASDVAITAVLSKTINKPSIQMRKRNLP